MFGKSPKILMLGWEFPPVINGGLGVACHDLSCSLSAHSDLTMVVPKSSPGYKMKNFRLLGANNLPAEITSSLEFLPPQELPYELQSVPADLYPYFSLEATRESRMIEGMNPFDIDNLYGSDVIEKVMQFADITAAMARKMDFDVIHAHDWMTMLAGIRIRQFSGKPLVMHIHSLEIDRSGTEAQGWVFDLEKYGMQCADLVIPVSNFTAENIVRYYGINAGKIRVVHNGSKKVVPFTSERKFAEKTVLFVGRLTRQKGPEKFLDIAARVIESEPNVRFVMAGVGDYFNSCLMKSASSAIGNRFHLTGFLNPEKLRYLFSISDVYCMPSVSEPFGLSAVEAAQFGIPCVISKQSGVSEVLTGALQFDHWDVDRAAGSIIHLLKDETLRKKVVNDASRSLDDITWENTARKIINIYKQENFI